MSFKQSLPEDTSPSTFAHVNSIRTSTIGLSLLTSPLDIEQLIARQTAAAAPLNSPNRLRDAILASAQRLGIPEKAPRRVRRETRQRRKRAFPEPAARDELDVGEPSTKRQRLDEPRPSATPQVPNNVQQVQAAAVGEGNIAEASQPWIANSSEGVVSQVQTTENSDIPEPGPEPEDTAQEQTVQQAEAATDMDTSNSIDSNRWEREGSRQYLMAAAAEVCLDCGHTQPCPDCFRRYGGFNLNWRPPRPSTAKEHDNVNSEADDSVLPNPTDPDEISVEGDEFLRFHTLDSVIFRQSSPEETLYAKLGLAHPSSDLEVELTAADVGFMGPEVIDEQAQAKKLHALAMRELILTRNKRVESSIDAAPMGPRMRRTPPTPLLMQRAAVAPQPTSITPPEQAPVAVQSRLGDGGRIASDVRADMPMKPFLSPIGPQFDFSPAQMALLRGAGRAVTCFRIADLYRAMSRPSPPGSVIEVFTFVTASQRTSDSTCQTFTFADIFFPKRPPYVCGVHAGCTASELSNDDSQPFLMAWSKDRGMLARAIVVPKPDTGRMPASGGESGLLKAGPGFFAGMQVQVLCIYESLWKDVEWTRGIIMEEQAKSTQD